jgi:hypothetical protein
VAVLLLVASFGTAAVAANPSSGTVGPPSGTSISWTGQTYAAAFNAGVCPAASVDPANVICDHFTLTVDVPATYWNTNTGGAEISITCPSPNDDFDLYVYQNGSLVGSSAGPTCTERVFIENAYGTYEVRVVPFLVIAGGYTGKALFASSPGGPAPGPIRGDGGIRFAPATVIDSQRTEGEPVNFIDGKGNYWESGPFGTSTQNSWVHRSVDGGDQFNITSPIGLRPDLPPGGGDTDIAVDSKGFAYFVDLEGLLNLGTAVSNDDGNTWKKNALGVANAIDDRQWLAIDNGTNDNERTVFLAFRELAPGSFIYSSPGSNGTGDLVGGLVYTNSSANLVAPVSTAAPCGQLRFDPVKRNLLYPCGKGTQVQITVGHVNLGQRTGITYRNVLTPVSPGGGSVSDIFPGVATDKAGNLYAVWVDRNDHNVYYSSSTNEGTTWSTPIRINGNLANSNVWPWAQGGNDGTLVVSWYGNSSHLDSNLMPSWYDSRQAATTYKWYGYASLITNATGATPSFAQVQFTEKPMHYGQICTGGLGCSTSNGDRTMADYFAVNLDAAGAMRIVYNDTTTQHHGAHLYEARQIAGPGAFGSPVNTPVPSNPMLDPTGDAQSPHYAPGTGPGPNLPQYDFTRLRLSQPDAGTLRVEMTLSSLASLLPPPGKASGVWLTRFQALSRGDQGEEAYRIFYVGAESTAGGPPSFFAGSGTSAQGAVPGNGCVQTTPENCKIVAYPAEFAADGSLSGNTITIDVRVQGGFGDGRPILGNTLFNVTALSAGRNSSTDLYADVDATRSFDYVLGTITPPPPACGGEREVNGNGEIQGDKNNDDFAVQCDQMGAKGDFRDAGSGVDFHTTRIDSATYNDTAHSVTLVGTGVNRTHLVKFTMVLVDSLLSGTKGSFSISLSDGYAKAGTLLSGKVAIR